MRTTLTTIFLIAANLTAQAQNDSLETVQKNELKFNPFLSELRFPEFSYERNQKHINFGSSLGVNISQD